MQAMDLSWRYKKPKPDMSLEELKEDLFRYIQQYDWVTFAELKRRYGDQFTGDYQWAPSPKEFKNIIYYLNLSEKAILALTALLKDKLIHMHTSSFLTYMLDGEVLRLPIARRIPKGGYKKEHWLPICFRPKNKCSLRECPNRNL